MSIQMVDVVVGIFTCTSARAGRVAQKSQLQAGRCTPAFVRTASVRPYLYTAASTSAAEVVEPTWATQHLPSGRRPWSQYKSSIGSTRAAHTGELAGLERFSQAKAG